jgi:hypothetical protein
LSAEIDLLLIAVPVENGAALLCRSVLVSAQSSWHFGFSIHSSLSAYSMTQGNRMATQRASALL